MAGAFQDFATHPTDWLVILPVVLALLTGPILLTRIFGGRLPDSRFVRIPWKVVADVETVVTVGVAADSLDASWTERWMRDHVIARIPGGRHDPE